MIATIQMTFLALLLSLPATLTMAQMSMTNNNKLKKPPTSTRIAALPVWFPYFIETVTPWRGAGGPRPASRHPARSAPGPAGWPDVRFAGHANSAAQPDCALPRTAFWLRSEEHTSELQSRENL